MSVMDIPTQPLVWDILQIYSLFLLNQISYFIKLLLILDGAERRKAYSFSSHTHPNKPQHTSAWCKESNASDNPIH